MKTVIDIETTVRENGDGKKSPSPYIPENYLVSVSIGGEAEDTYLCFKHNTEPPTSYAIKLLQEILDKTTLLIGHNIKFDLSWLLECGFKYDGDVYDTMVYEYIKRGGLRHIRLNLAACCERRKLPLKDDVPKSYMKEGIGFEAMPWEIVESYGKNDVYITWALYKHQNDELNGNSSYA